MPFSIIHDLDSLSDQQKRDYAASAAVHFGLDPSLNPFDFIWLTQDSGFRKLCLYARRGTTDILRHKHSISVISLVQHDGPGYVSFTATGKNPAGRQEIAVGSAFTDGLRGESLAAAVMTAQTRALRRMTLQFEGVGILDVSEVNAPAETDQKITTPINLAPAPAVAISHEAGKDITPVSVEYHAPSVPATLPEHSGSKLVIAPAPFSGGDIIPNTVETREQVQSTRDEAIAKLNEQAAPTAEPVKKTRKRRAKVDLGPSEPVTLQSIIIKPEARTALEIGASGELGAAMAVSVNAAVEKALVAPEPAPAVPAKPRLTRDEVKPFRQRLFKLVNEQLEPAGFAPKEGVGNSDKMRSFAQLMFPDITTMNDLNLEQWEKYLNALETKFSKDGASGTIKYIEESIGL